MPNNVSMTELGPSVADVIITGKKNSKMAPFLFGDAVEKLSWEPRNLIELWIGEWKVYFFPFAS